MQSHDSFLRARPSSAASTSRFFRAEHLLLIAFAIAVPALQGEAQIIFGSATTKRVPLPPGASMRDFVIVDMNNDGYLDAVSMDAVRGLATHKYDGVSWTEKQDDATQQRIPLRRRS